MNATGRPGGDAVTLITGAAGNLGSILARHLLVRGHRLRLMFHRKPLPEDLASARGASAVCADLGEPATLAPAVEGVAAVVHFAGVLFKPHPESFLSVTNTSWFANLLTAAVHAQVARVILISFPQVEGPTSFEHPAE